MSGGEFAALKYMMTRPCLSATAERYANALQYTHIHTQTHECKIIESIGDDSCFDTFDIKAEIINLRFYYSSKHVI